MPGNPVSVEHPETDQAVKEYLPICTYSISTVCVFFHRYSYYMAQERCPRTSAVLRGQSEHVQLHIISIVCIRSLSYSTMHLTDLFISNKLHTFNFCAGILYSSVTRDLLHSHLIIRLHLLILTLNMCEITFYYQRNSVQYFSFQCDPVIQTNS